MDPLSLTASIITSVSLTSNTSEALRNLYDLRHAPREVLELGKEVSKNIFFSVADYTADMNSRLSSCKVSCLWYKRRLGV